MSLQYGFNSNGWDKDDAKWKAKFDALGENEKDYYHNVLPWVMVMTDVSHVSKETIPVIVHRIFKVSDEFVPTRGGVRLVEPQLEEFLQMFVGFEANVNTLTDREWAKRFIPKDWEKRKSLKSDAQVQAERLRFEKEIFGADRKALYGR